MSAFLRKKLKEWDMEEYIQKFIEQEIDEETFMALEDKNVAHLIPKMGRRILFMKKLDQWREEKKTSENLRANIEETRRSTPECQAGPSTSSDSYPNTPKLQSNPIKNNISDETHRPDIIRGYLNKTPKGKSILKKYETSTWSPTDRKELAALIINEETSIPPERLQELAELIKQAFPIETAHTYYVPYEHNKVTGKRTLRGGKLWIQYNKTRIKLEKKK